MKRKVYKFRYHENKNNKIKGKLTGSSQVGAVLSPPC